jgi:hypothetical protein
MIQIFLESKGQLLTERIKARRQEAAQKENHI